MSSISVSHDRPEVINPLSWVLAFSQSGGTGVSLFAIVVKLGSEELGDFVGDGVGWIVYVSWCVRKRVNEAMVGGGDGNLPARSGPGSREDEAVEEHCQPETYTVSRYLAI